MLIRHLKSHGKLLWEYANCIDNSEVDTDLYDERKGIGFSSTLAYDTDDNEEIYKYLYNFSKDISKKLKEKKVYASSITVTIRNNEFKTYNHGHKYLNAVNEVAGKSSPQVDTLPTANASNEGRIVQYVGVHNIHNDYTTNRTGNFVGAGNSNNYIINNTRDLHLASIYSGYGMIECNKKLTNRGTLTIVRKQRSTGSSSAYMGTFLGTSMGASNVYQSPAWGDIGIDNTRTDIIDLSQFSASDIYLSFRVDVASGNNLSYDILSVIYDATDPIENGHFYKCVNNSGVYSWQEIFVQDNLSAGDGIVIDSIANTVSADIMPSADMSEVVSPLPGVMSRRMKYSTEEQIIGEWIDGKPIYQKTVNFGALPNATIKNVAHNINNIGYVVSINAVATNGTYYLELNYAPQSDFNTSTPRANVYLNGTQITIESGNYNFSSYSAYITVQYTKSTD